MKKILIVCGAGASSAFMARNIRQALKAHGLTEEYTFIARSDSELDEYLNDIDMLLLGPHLSYMLESMRKYCEAHHVPVYVIDKKAYGMLDGNAVVNFVREKLSREINA